MYLYSIMPLDAEHVDEICKDIKEQYENLLLHAIIMSVLGYSNDANRISISQVVKDSNIEKQMELLRFRKWVSDKFNTVHAEAFLKSPIYVFDPNSDEFVSVKEK